MAAALALLLLAEGRVPLGVFESWGAFRDPSPLRCFAIAWPAGQNGRGEAFASIATWPREGARNQLHIRLSRPRAANARVTLAVGERRFELKAGAADAWAPDSRTDTAVVAAMRDGRSMSIETLAANGAPFADTYALKGAATAIDAAAAGCAGK
ncbi:invasion associated locus B family protein [Sphingomonas sp. DT-207]|uniref:invasion associated locus B family protein n=1 Tax=Sphingomonas sp. DT-207 TaxID=3396167 RepID=UPI003F1CF403